MRKFFLIGMVLIIISGGVFWVIKSSSGRDENVSDSDLPQDTIREDGPETIDVVTIDSLLSDVSEIISLQDGRYSEETIIWRTKDEELELEGRGYVLEERLGANERGLKDKYGKLSIYLNDLGFEYDLYNVGSTGIGFDRRILRRKEIGCELYLKDDNSKGSRILGFFCAMLPDELANPKETAMSEKRARSIAETSSCVGEGKLKDTAFYNESTKTWWIDLDVERQGCNPACVVFEDESVEINWRCTGLIKE